MGRYFALTLGLNNFKPRVKNKTQKSDTSLLMPKSKFWLVSLSIILAIVYLLEVNSLSTKGYEIAKLEKILLELKEKNKRLELDAATLNSIQGLEALGKTLNLVPGKLVNYPQETNYVYDHNQLN